MAKQGEAEAEKASKKWNQNVTVFIFSVDFTDRRKAVLSGAGAGRLTAQFAGNSSQTSLSHRELTFNVELSGAIKRRQLRSVHHHQGIHAVVVVVVLDASSASDAFRKGVSASLLIHSNPARLAHLHQAVASAAKK